MAVLKIKPIHWHLVVCWNGDWHCGFDDQQESGAEQMRQIDIDSLDEATLIELNARIVERLQYLHHQRPRRPFKASGWGAAWSLKALAALWSGVSLFAATRRR
ncbi:hypothetical protein [Rhizobium sp. CSW-27]|uniref:hypothetical protein n=1 Tax=Rhizobium sp. CSW-27 TaxID=2839985 RepID=UPI001C02B3EC|nr:hypothetical protein [Rhizobium sp. CSW-27]MBT9370832.1 hypothetical protein [Rhizobium sp. CSW-27]